MCFSQPLFLARAPRHAMLRHNTGLAHPFRISHRLGSNAFSPDASLTKAMMRMLRSSRSMNQLRSVRELTGHLVASSDAHCSATRHPVYQEYVHATVRLRCTQPHHPNCGDCATSAGLPAACALDIVLACKPKQSAIQGGTA
jgi:hypothetical protein